MTQAEKYQAMLCKLENTSYSTEQLYGLCKKLLKILINKEEAEDVAFDLLRDIYQRDDQQ